MQMKWKSIFQKLKSELALDHTISNNLENASGTPHFNFNAGRFHVRERDNGAITPPYARFKVRRTSRDKEEN
ncbi:14782_t:CDS:2 [Acaulospora morrowiae]|uniref:14782_t:CDS:1 n=1 Tax=Acaulospora morrowiae TaxID=94023 RepID=A0A9N8ZGX7_9GLOM|nr:14782_t:CDS:2 [Acaulospora morrowiae]